jgi:hypothetical protein
MFFRNKIYPNPTVDILQLELGLLDISGGFRYSIYNLQGQKVIKERRITNIIKISINKFSRWIYSIISYEDDNELSSLRFVKQ